MSEERFFFENKKGEKLAAVIHLPKKKTDKCIVLCHGFTGRKESWHHEAHELENAGYAVLRFDFSGNGESEGRFEDAGYLKEVSDLEAALDELTKRGFNKICTLGHSMGGGVVVLTAAKDKRITAVITSAAKVFPSKERFAKYAKEWKNTTLSREFLEEVPKLNIIGAAQTLTQPLLVMVGSEDDVAPPSESEELFKSAKGPKEFVLIEGEGHDLEGFDGFIKVIATWLKKNF